MTLNRASDVLANDWPSQTHVKNHRNFSGVVIRRFFSEVEILTKHSSSVYVTNVTNSIYSQKAHVYLHDFIMATMLFVQDSFIIISKKQKYISASSTQGKSAICASAFWASVRAPQKRTRKNC